MANEWSELATVRRVSTALTYVSLSLILVSLNQRWVASPRPTTSDLSVDESQNLNPALQFAVAAFWFLILVIGQLAYVYLIAERFIEPSPVLRFVDLCTVAKISMVVLDERYHGFYLHCDAPYDFADGDMRQLVLSLTDEAGTVRAGRGLIGAPADAQDAQAFELFLPMVWRRLFDSFYRRLRDELTSKSTATPGVVPSATSTAGGGPKQSSIKAGVDRDAAVLRHNTGSAISRFIKGFVVKDQRAAGLSRVFRERNYLQTFFHIPPDVEAENQAVGLRGADEGVSVFMIDRNMRIEALLFRGAEWDLLLLSFLFFAVVQFYTSDPVFASAVAVGVDFVIGTIRKEWGKSNLASKTLVDSRFLA